MFKQTLAILLLLLSLSVIALAENGKTPPTPTEKPQKTINCKKCKGTGRIKHKKNFRPLMDAQENTKQLWLCELCCTEKLNWGLYWSPCPKCEDPGETQKYNTLIEERKAFLNWIKERNQKLGIPQNYIRTKHFDIAWNIRSISCSGKTRQQYKLSKKPKTLNTHEALHVYAMRAEDAFDIHQRAFTLPEDQELDRTTIYWTQTNEQKETILRNHETYKGTPSANWQQASTSPCIWESLKDDWKNDDQLKFTQTHLIGHCIHDKWSHKTPLFPITWTTVGYGHWLEYEQFHDSRIHCFKETQPQSDDWGFGHWRYKIYKKIKSGRTPSFPDIMNRNHETYDYFDHAFSFAYVDFLIYYDSKKWNQFSKAHRKYKKYEPALEEVYNWSPLLFEEMFKDWVLKYYPNSAKADDRWTYNPDKPRPLKK